MRDALSPGPSLSSPLASRAPPHTTLYPSPEQTALPRLTASNPTAVPFCTRLRLRNGAARTGRLSRETHAREMETTASSYEAVDASERRARHESDKLCGRRRRPQSPAKLHKASQAGHARNHQHHLQGLELRL